MMTITFTKNTAYRAISDIKVGSSVQIHKGEVVICSKGGKKPTLEGSQGGVTGSPVALGRFLEPASPAETEALKRELGISGATQYRKGDFAIMTKPYTFSDGETLPEGSRLRCLKGGAKPTFLFFIEDTEAESSLPLSHISPSTRVEDCEALGQVISKLKTFKEMSEETIAFVCTITFDGMTLHAKNDGHGGCHLVTGSRTAELKLDEILTQAIVEAGMERQAGEDLTDHYLDYLCGPDGLMTFAEYVRRFRTAMEDLMASKPLN
ncbi:hypothetical protein VRRI112168_02610 [Vreelandella rituensis]|uniref:Uncharacterized protein n=1 Tax=Vreelandella rituensis TaxID=2282306 RepID=A0A368UAK1_9GAMM|nr:hypothetical protein [Halomonas rituensis]RCV93636.1 hypothetical protein DU506_00330 [Halomonas rituensis]